MGNVMSRIDTDEPIAEALECVQLKGCLYAQDISFWIKIWSRRWWGYFVFEKCQYIPLLKPINPEFDWDQVFFVQLDSGLLNLPGISIDICWGNVAISAIFRCHIMYGV
jgi:hypothetical protein